MKKLFTFVVTMLLGAALAFAQTGGDKKPADKTDTATQSAQTAPSGKKASKGAKKGHKGGKKSKKGSESTTPPPK